MVTLTQDFNPGTVALACAVAFIGAYATVSLCEQFRLASAMKVTLRHLPSLIMAGFAFGGVGIWGVFYLVVNSCRLKFPDGTLLTWRYDIFDTFLALAVAPVIAGFGLWVASTDHCFNKSKKEIMDLFITRTTAAATYSISEIKHMSRYRILFIVCTHSPERLILGGIIGGGGTALMRYLGLRSLVIPGNIHYDSGITALTVLLSMLIMISGFWIFFRVLSIFSSLDWLRFLCAVQGIAGMAGIHYIALAGVRFEYDPAVSVNLETSISPRPFIVSILCGTVIYSFTALIYVLSDLREWLLKTSTQLRQADLALAALMKKSLESRDYNYHHNNNNNNNSGSVGSPHNGHNANLNSSLQKYTQYNHTHFQAPIEVINYTRRYMEQADENTRTSQIGFAGMTLPPPMFNDFNVEGDVEMGNLQSLNNTINEALTTPNMRHNNPNNDSTDAFNVQNPDNMSNNDNNPTNPQYNPNNTNTSNNSHNAQHHHYNSNYPTSPTANGVINPSPVRGLHEDPSAQFRGQLSLASKSGSNNSTQLAQQLANLRYKPMHTKSNSTTSASVLAGFDASSDATTEINGVGISASGSGGISFNGGGISTTNGGSSNEVRKAVNEENGNSDKDSIGHTEAATTVHDQ